MIVVIADDLTGAAELAGIGLRYNLRVEVGTAVNRQTDAELFIVSADTRSMNEADAVLLMSAITREVAKLRPELVYKKIDSVLRGHVIAELREQMKALNQQNLLLVPANPTLGRTIHNGEYFFNGKPIHLSSFSNDPEFAVTSSQVLKMLNVADDFVSVRKKDDDLPQQGIIVGEVAHEHDLQVWASKADTLLAAGASGFFTAILSYRKKNGSAKQQLSTPLATPVIYVSGTTFARSRNSIKQLSENRGPVSYMPESIVASENYNESACNKWRDEILLLIQNNGKAIIAIDDEITGRIPSSAYSLRLKTADIVERVFNEISLCEILIEGGSTAASIIRHLNFKTFYPVEELSPGVVRMAVEGQQDLYMTVKPGSYEWPGKLWNF